jgi:hypothetical protein
MATDPVLVVVILPLKAKIDPVKLIEVPEAVALKAVAAKLPAPCCSVIEAAAMLAAVTEFIYWIVKALTPLTDPPNVRFPAVPLVVAEVNVRACPPPAMVLENVIAL